ncbi:MAG: hypothetical protein ACK4K7_12380 [Allosphingosinicella sp.]|uniref:hypothetical protein n=1 Tax=Allosphingosinicella sp. TaxID=2823234 RepID=UPI0039511B29
MNLGKVLIGAVAAAFAMFIIGALFFATPLRGLGQGNLPNAQAAEVQRTLAANLPNTGTYIIPDGGTQEQTVMYGQGPIATVHYNTDGFAAFDAGSMAAGFVLYLLIALFIAGALWLMERQVRDFPTRAKVVSVLAVAASAYIHLKMPIFYHHGWGHYVYFFVADALTLSAGGLIIARWFLPANRTAPADAPTDV